MDMRCVRLWRRDFMQTYKEGLFFALKETLVQHVGVTSSQNNSFWQNDRFVDSSSARVPPRARLPSSRNVV